MAFREGRIIREFSLRGRKVVFRYPKRSDIDNFLKHINSLVEERAYIGKQKRVTRKEEIKWMEEMFKKIRKGEQLKVCVEVDGRFAGSSEIKRNVFDAEKHVATLGIGLQKGFRGMGIGTELMRTMEELARKEMKAKVIELTCFSLNDTANRVYQKAGFSEVGRVRTGINYYGKYCDKIIMAKVLK